MSAPTLHVDDSGRESVPIDAGTAANLLPRLRDLAAQLEPPRAELYADMPLSRFRDSADHAAQLLLEHRCYVVHLRAGTGPRHRHAHDLVIVDLLSRTSSIDLGAATAMLALVADRLDEEAAERNRP